MLSPSTWPFLGFFFLGIIIYLLISEIASQDCESQVCVNATPCPERRDMPEEIIDKLIVTLRTNHSPVEWRKALLIGLIISFVILFPRITLRNYLLVALIIFFTTYFSLTWSSWNYWRKTDNYIEEQLLSLRS